MYESQATIVLFAEYDLTLTYLLATRPQNYFALGLEETDVETLQRLRRSRPVRAQGR